MNFSKIAERNMKIVNLKIQQIISRLIKTFVFCTCVLNINSQAQELPEICEQVLSTWPVLSVCGKDAIIYAKESGDIQAANKMKEKLKSLPNMMGTFKTVWRKRIAAGDTEFVEQNCTEVKNTLNNGLQQVLPVLTMYGAMSENCHRQFIQIQLQSRGVSP